jgi:hypothetical protein
MQEKNYHTQIGLRVKASKPPQGIEEVEESRTFFKKEKGRVGTINNWEVTISIS